MTKAPMRSYHVRDLFSLRTNTAYFDGLLHFFSGEAEAVPEFQFIMNNRLRISTEGKAKVNLMLYYNSRDGAIEFNYPWFVPVSAKLLHSPDFSKICFHFTRNYLRFSNIVAEGWELIDLFRSLLQIALMRRNMCMIHGGAVRLHQKGILIPSFGNTGKTSTSWMLSKQGADFLTDEFAILDQNGNCFGFPCSSLISQNTIRSLGLELSSREKISLFLNEARSKILTTRWAPGGIKVYPENFLKVCDEVKINAVVFLQNGVELVQRITADDALARLRAIQSYEMAWRANPFVIAESFFNPAFDLAQVAATEEKVFKNLFSGIDRFYLVSSSSGTHYRAIETIASD